MPAPGRSSPPPGPLAPPPLAPPFRAFIISWPIMTWVLSLILRVGPPSVPWSTYSWYVGANWWTVSDTTSSMEMACEMLLNIPFVPIPEYTLQGNAFNMKGAAMIISTQMSTFCSALPSAPVSSTPSETSMAHTMLCQKVRKMTDLTRTNFITGLYGLSKSCAPR